MNGSRWASIIAFDLLISGTLVITHVLVHTAVSSLIIPFGGLAIGTGLSIIIQLFRD